MEEGNVFTGFDFGGGGFDWNTVFETEPGPETENAPPKEKEKRKRERTRMYAEHTERWEYHRAFSEVKLLETMEYEPLEKDTTYNFITGGDVDSLSFLKIVLNRHALDYLLFSTWCIAAEDVLQFRQWYESGKIRHLDMYFGEMVPSTYAGAWQMVKEFYKQYPDAGRTAVFVNHTKIYAGADYGNDFYFGIQTSANINTNPRAEQASITTTRGLFEFYKEYFDGIRTILKE